MDAILETACLASFISLAWPGGKASCNRLTRLDAPFSPFRGVPVTAP